MGKEKLIEFKIKYEGLIDAATFYNSICDFFKSNNFSYEENSFEYSQKNNKISLKVNIGFSKEYEENISVKGELSLEFEDLEEVSAKIGENIKTLQNGKVSIKLKVDYIDEYGEKIEDKLQKFLANLYKTTIAKKHFKKIKESAEKDMKELVLLIKKQLNLNKYMS